MARDLVNRCKHVFHGLATVVWFLQLRLARSRERCHHVLAPFLSYYFSIHQTIYNVCGRANKGIGHLGNYGKVTHEQYSRIYSRDKANTCITRLKAYVWAIVAVVRMSRTKSVQGSTALEYYCNYALANRDKIDNLNEYLDRLSETAL